MSLIRTLGKCKFVAVLAAGNVSKVVLNI